jgi:hypothetical protein
VNEFRINVKEGRFDFLLDEVLLASEAVHVSPDNIAFLKQTISVAFGIKSEVRVWIVGSAKLGFSISEKRAEGVVLPRYRTFSSASDIDVAIICNEIFELLWHELSAYAHRAQPFPWDSKRLGDYLVCGWFRPDHFPGYAHLRYCDTWWNVFRRLSADIRYGRRKVRGGLYADVEHLKRYLNRSLSECQQAENMAS